MSNKEDGNKGWHIYFIVVSIVCVVIFLAAVLFYFNLRHVKKTAAETDNEISNDALSDIYTELSQVYGISFTAVLDGNSKEDYFPSWLLEVLGDTKEKSVSIEGSVYGSAMDLYVQIEDSKDYITIYVTDDGCYIKNYMGYDYVRVSSKGVTGRTVLNNCLSMIIEMKNTEGLRLGTTEDSYNAFCFDSGFSYGGISLPDGFSAYEIPSNTELYGFTFYGYGSGIEINLSVVENTEYVLKEIVSNPVDLSTINSVGLSGEE
mgnify:CR=1 FL=1